MSSSYNKDYTPRLSTDGLYSPVFEHEACGVGLVANIRGRKSHAVIEQGLEVLINLGHRGASGADPETGDGAGIIIQMPHEFVAAAFGRIGISVPERGSYGVGMTFLPRDAEERSRCEAAVERIVAAEGQRFLGWRDVPASPGRIGTLSARVMPTIRQFLVGRSESTESGRDFELRLLVIRKQIEKAILGDDLSAQSDFYVCSLSSRTIVYKGLVMAHQLQGLLPRSQKRRDDDGVRPRPLSFLNKHPWLMEAGPPVQIHHPQRRNKHSPGQHQLDGRQGEELRVRHLRRRRR